MPNPRRYRRRLKRNCGTGDGAIQRTVDAGGQAELSGAIAGTVSIDGASLSIAYEFPGNLVLEAEIPTLNLGSVVNQLCGAELLGGLPAAT